ncbi:hypothetical protein ABKN59_001470 [Abortiporus biennis]
MALSFIGKPISLVSHSDVRYRGILAGIDPVQSTIQLSNVYSMGTESRRPPDQFIPPVAEPYSYIIFRASEVKDLAVDEPTPRRNVHDDPAVLGASAPMAQGTYGFPAGQPGQQPVPQQGTPQQQQQQQRQGFQQRQAGPQAGSPPAPNQNATASLESVERAIGDLRVAGNGNEAAASHHHHRGGAPGRRGGRHGHDNKAADFRVPTTDFDFQGSNAKFDKAALGPSPKPSTPRVDDENVNGNSSDDSGSGEGNNAEKGKDKESAYNPKKSFFDSLSSGSNGPSNDGRGGRGGRGRGNGRNRREEERERNVATFGEPGGIGLMGPGAYVGGWGGYGRRGGGRGRRGGAPVGTRS